MALQNKTTILIGGKEIITFKRFSLHQQIDAHNILDIDFRMDVLEDLEKELGEESKNFLGEIITVQISSLEELNYNELEFKGVVTQVRTLKGHDVGSGDYIKITAQSPTYLADDGPHYASYNDVSLSEILEKTFQYYDKSKLEIQVQPKNNGNIHYSVQHNESAYEYASRLAAQYGEWFFYNGSKLIFGKPETNEIELSYGFDLKEYYLDLIPQSHNYKYFHNNYLQDEILQKDAKEFSSGANGYSGFVSNKAKDIFNKETQVWHNLYNDKQVLQRFDKHIEAQKKAIEIKQVQLTGISDNPGVKLGNIVKINGGTYRVINITHTNNQNGNYENRFEAITAEFDAYPNTNIEAYPRSEIQTAVVTENSDTEGLGRIRVQFSWQKIVGEQTPWIRIVTPHAGGDKGFHFIPEIGEEVLIGFEGGNAEKPYMLGSLYNGSGKAESFKNNNNDIKAIRTRSGHTIELNDTNGEEKINIYDNDGSIITFDTKNKSLQIQATENLDISAKNITITAEENIDIKAKADITTTAEGDTKIQAKGKANLQTNGAIAISSKAKIAIEAKADAVLKGQNIKTEAKIAAELQGKQTKINGEQTSVEGKLTTIKGASGKIDVV